MPRDTDRARDAQSPPLPRAPAPLQPVALSGNQWHSVALSGNQWQLVAISGNQRLPLHVASPLTNQWQSVASAARTCHVARAKRGHVAREAAITMCRVASPPPNPLPPGVAARHQRRRARTHEALLRARARPREARRAKPRAHAHLAHPRPLGRGARAVRRCDCMLIAPDWIWPKPSQHSAPLPLSLTARVHSSSCRQRLPWLARRARIAMSAAAF